MDATARPCTHQPRAGAQLMWVLIAAGSGLAIGVLIGVLAARFIG